MRDRSAAVEIVAAGVPGQPAGGWFLTSKTIPADPTLAGITVTSQYFVIDPEGPGGAVLSDGLTSTILP